MHCIDMHVLHQVSLLNRSWHAQGFNGMPAQTHMRKIYVKEIYM